MSFAPFYIVWMAFYRAVEFLRHWYLHGFYLYSHWVISLLERLDRFFAFRISLRNLGQPLFQDRSAVGYIMGFAFRSGRVLVGGIVYLLVFILALFIYLIWALVPIYLLLNIFFPS